MFTTSYKDVGSGDLFPEGEFECQIIKAEVTRTKPKEGVGKPYISIELVGRDDVEQACGRKHIWDNLFKNKETGEYNAKRINSICKYTGVPEGLSLDEQGFCDYIVLKYIRIVVKQQMDDYKGEKVARIRYYKPSAVEGAEEANKADFIDTSEYSDGVEDADLPF